MHDSEQEHRGITGCRVTYESTIFYNEANKFSIIVVKTSDPRIPPQACNGRYYGDRMLRFTAVGYELPRTKAVELELDGEWVENKYGYQLQVEQWQEIVPQTADGLLAYLGSGLIKGIGPKTAEDIVATFGPDTLNILDNSPEKLLQIRGIADVVELLGLTVRRRLPSSLYLNCPFCGDQRGRLNVNTDKNVWRCNRCGAAGGMLALYAHYYCTSNADAYREICEALGRYTPRPRVNDCIGIKPEQNARATPQEIHQTYSLLLSMLPLTPTHKAHLLSPRRGLTEYQIARFGLKSTPPAFLCRGYAERLRRQGCTLQGVPGFYQDDAGRWTINFGSRTAGILLPAVGLDGLICGMQIRLDTPLRRRDDPPGKSGAKYIWLSSIGKPHGVTSGSPLHFVGEPFAKTVYVTEGLLKADIAHCLTGRSFIAVAGVNSLNGLESALRCMAQNGTKLVVEAYDMDKLENEYVASAAEKVQQIAHAAGLQSTSLVWNTAYKGIDDWQLALRQEEVKENAA